MSKIFLATGGTGGHIYPALEVAEGLTALGYDLHFIGTNQGLESSMVKYPLHKIAGGKLNFPGRWLNKIFTILKVLWAMVESFFLLVYHRPKVVVGFGGYSSGPMVFIAALLGFKTIIWEANEIPGLTNKILEKVVGKVLVNSLSTSSFFKAEKAVWVRYPIRKGFIVKESVEKNNPLKVLVIGGSQGSLKVNESVIALLLKNKGEFQWWIQTGPHELEINSTDEVKREEFIADMPNAINWADVIISRAGAGAVAEVRETRTPTIFIPLKLADGHQEKNAQFLVDRQSALIIDENELSVESLESKLALIKSYQIRSGIVQNLKTLNSAQVSILEEVIKTLES